jgi:hypothetical protein
MTQILREGAHCNMQMQKTGVWVRYFVTVLKESLFGKCKALVPCKDMSTFATPGACMTVCGAAVKLSVFWRDEAMRERLYRETILAAPFFSPQVEGSELLQRTEPLRQPLHQVCELIDRWLIPPLLRPMVYRGGKLQTRTEKDQLRCSLPSQVRQQAVQIGF